MGPVLSGQTVSGLRGIVGHPAGVGELENWLSMWGK